MTQSIDGARLTLMLNDLRLPAIKQDWAGFAERRAALDRKNKGAGRPQSYATIKDLGAAPLPDKQTKT